jgi:hypothetical protein
MATKNEDAWKHRKKATEPEKSIADRLAVIRGHALRREILQAAQEAHAQGRLVSPVGLSKQLDVPLSKLSYHVKVLVGEGGLELLDEQPRRGAVEHLYGINEDLLAEITDSVALDQITELLDGTVVGRANPEILDIVRSTGRPVEA